MHLPVELVETDFAPVCEGDGLRASESRLRVIHAHGSVECIVAIHNPDLVWTLYLEIGDWWVVRCMFAEESGPIFKRALMSLSKQRIEGFLHVKH